MTSKQLLLTSLKISRAWAEQLQARCCDRWEIPMGGCGLYLCKP